MIPRNNGPLHQEPNNISQLPSFQTAHQEPLLPYTSMSTFNNSSSSCSMVMLYDGGEGGDIPFCYPATRIVRGSVMYQVPVIHLHVVCALVYYAYSYFFVSITANRHGQQEFCCTVFFYTAFGARHTSKTYRVHQLTAPLPLNGQL